MTQTEFWNLIDSSITENRIELEKQISLIVNQLSQFSIEDIREFNFLSETLIEKTKNEAVFKAISEVFKDEIIFEGNISWSRFDSFAGWLILQGFEIYNQIILTPSSLKELVKTRYDNDLEKCSSEEAIFIACSAYELKTGRNYFEDF